MLITECPAITIFVRHRLGCKYTGNEFSRKCSCRKHLRWTQGGKQYRVSAKTRSWEQAELNKRNLEIQLAGGALPSQQGHTLDEAIKTFLANKKAQGISEHAYKMYVRELALLQSFSDKNRTFTASAALTMERLTAFRDTWTYGSTYTQAVTQKRLRHFLRFLYNNGWIERIPALSPIKIKSPETQPLSAAAYTKLLESITKVFAGEKATKVRAIIQLMRWSGLAVRDASTLKRAALSLDDGIYRIISTRVKTGTPLFIPIPEDVAEEILAVANGSPTYLFWEWRGGDEGRQARHVGEDIAEVFKAAGINCDGHMVSHRLRSTFAVDLLQKGVPLEHVSKLLGHRSIKTTEEAYAKWVKGRQDLLTKVVSLTWKEKKASA